jgi:folate-binding protein YgfZ
MTRWADFLARRGARLDRGTVKSFGDIAAELAAARDGAVVCDLAPLGVLCVSGPDAAQFLHGQLTSDVQALERGAWQYSAWCSPKGRMLADFVVRRAHEERFDLMFSANLLETIRKRLGMFVLRSKVTIEDASAASVRLGVGGPKAEAAVRAAWGALPSAQQSVEVGGSAVITLPGRRWIAWLEPASAPSVWERLAASALPVGFPTWEWLTIRAGVPLITPPTSDQYIPQMVNWDALDGVSFGKGCYSGQEIVARMHYLGRLKERLALAHVDAPPPAAGERLFGPSFGDQACGSVVNAAPAPGVGADLLAVLQLAARDAGEVRVGSHNGPALTLLPLPYALTETAAPRGRIA